MATTIKSPQEGYTGTTSFGPLTLDFKDGEASTDEKLSDGHKAYFKAHGFKVSGSRAAAEKPAEDGPFDPSKHDVKEVVAYLDQPNVDWEEIARVVSAEREGKARKGIVEWLPPKGEDPEESPTGETADDAPDTGGDK